MQKNHIALGCALALLATPALSAEFKGEGMFPWAATGTMFTVTGDHPLFLGAFTGITTFTDPSAPLQNGSIQCPGYYDIGVDAAGYCTETATDGDQVFVKWSCKATTPPAGALGACEGRADFVGGTGKFASAKGGNNFRAVTLSAFPDGTTTGYSELNDYEITY